MGTLWSDDMSADHQLRIECLKIAAATLGGQPPERIVELARAYYAFLTEKAK